MFKKVLLLCFLFTFNVMALDIGDKIPSNIVKVLKFKKDKIYVVDFFASWCHSCKKELPLLVKLQKKIDKSKVEIIGIDVDENIASGKRFQKALGLNFRVVNDSKNSVIGVFNPIGMPSVYLVKNGKIVDAVMGVKPHIDNYLLKKLQELK